jgi:hypothetical protein
MVSQEYSDITFIFGPPAEDIYERFLQIAAENDQIFSDVYRAFIRDLFDRGGGEKLLNELFSAVVGEELSLNEVFQTYQCWWGRKDKFEKFYLTSTDQDAKVPAIMVFPPKFTNSNGETLETIVDFEHANLVSAMIGQSLKLDWVEIHAVNNDQGGGFVTQIF